MRTTLLWLLGCSTGVLCGPGTAPEDGVCVPRDGTDTEATDTDLGTDAETTDTDPPTDEDT